MNQLRVPVAFGSVRLVWDEQGLLQRILLEKEAADVPSFMTDMARRIQRACDFGEPIGEVDWSICAKMSSFQEEIRDVVGLIPYGETRTYGWVARHLGRVQLARAVGRALSANPFPLLVPCHRVQSEPARRFLGQDFFDIKQILLKKEELYRSPMFSNAFY